MSLAFACVLLTSGPTLAESILPTGCYPDLDAKMAQHERQFYFLNALPFGLSLDVHPADEAAVVMIDQFLAQGASDDFEAVTGQHVYELLRSYGEHGDLGFFGGVAVVGTAFRYLALKREGAPEVELAAARQKVVRAAEAWHVFYAVTGGEGLVARGIMRLGPEDPADPALPNPTVEIVPLADENGDPLPQPKDNGTWRDELSAGALPTNTWIWEDSCSKDQLTGQVLGLVSLYEAMKDDPDIDQALVTRLAEDARKVGQMLMTQHEISEMEGPFGSGEYDLIIMDADGRPTFHHGLNPASIEKIYMDPEGSFNRFNLLLALGVIKGLHHVSGDSELEAFLYDEMLVKRDYLDKINGQESKAADYIYMGGNTNFDNPDMVSVAMFLSLYLETDPSYRTELLQYFEAGWWQRPEESHTARLCKQPLWHAFYLALTEQGSDPTLIEELRQLLEAFDLGPYWNPQRINCDDDEIAARQCLAIDGQTILHLANQDDKGRWMATEALDPSIRPPSNFDARSNPFRVNGGGGLRLNPGGDLLTAYWLGRYFQQRETGEAAISPHALEHMPLGGWPDGGDPEDGGTTPIDEPGGGCGCGTESPDSAAGLLFVGWLLWLLRRRTQLASFSEGAKS
ncbi:MAG: hypothetical protein JRF33_25190 [Deltaproteobacteria bacterium]|nr:hypothetical protein [Deltaproteobacteria bacterium]